MPIHYFSYNLSPVYMLARPSGGERVVVVAVGYTPINGGLILSFCAHHNVMDGTDMGVVLGR